MAKRGSRTATETRTAWAAELLLARAGEPSYRLVTTIKEEFGIGRRAAQNVLARARRKVAEQQAETLLDIGNALGSELRRLLDLAHSMGDVKAAAAVLRIAADVTAAGRHLQTQTGDTPGLIEFVVRPVPEAGAEDDREDHSDGTTEEGETGHRGNGGTDA